MNLLGRVMDGWMVPKGNEGPPKPLARKVDTSGTLGSNHPFLDLRMGVEMDSSVYVATQTRCITMRGKWIATTSGRDGSHGGTTADSMFKLGTGLSFPTSRIESN